MYRFTRLRTLRRGVAPEPTGITAVMPWGFTDDDRLDGWFALS